MSLRFRISQLDIFHLCISTLSSCLRGNPWKQVEVPSTKTKKGVEWAWVLCLKAQVSKPSGDRTNEQRRRKAGEAEKSLERCRSVFKNNSKELAMFIFVTYALRLLNCPCFGCKNRTRSSKTPQCKTAKAGKYLKCNGVRFFKLFAGLFGPTKETGRRQMPEPVLML